MIATDDSLANGVTRSAERSTAPAKSDNLFTCEGEPDSPSNVPTGLEEGTHSRAETHETVARDAKSDAIYADLIEILTRWPTLPPQVREQVLSLVHYH